MKIYYSTPRVQNDETQQKGTFCKFVLSHFGDVIDESLYIFRNARSNICVSSKPAEFDCVMPIVDVMIMELPHADCLMGYELRLAQELNIPTICLCAEEQRPACFDAADFLSARFHPIIYKGNDDLLCKLSDSLFGMLLRPH